MKYVLADSSTFQTEGRRKQNSRGINVYTLSELRGVTGRTQRGELITGEMQYPMFCLTPIERMAIMQACSYVQAVVGSRMNRISSLEWNVTKKADLEDEYYYKIKHLKEVYDERDNAASLEDLLLRYKIRLMLKKELPELRDDLTNLDAAMRRWKKQLKLKDNKSIQEIEDWIREPNLEDDFNDFIKKYVESYMVHGATGVYKDYQDQKLENFYTLPGGTVYPLRSEQVGGYVAYAQIIMGYDTKIYFQNEISFSNYLPSAARSYGYVPLDALVNKVAETLLFDELAAERADGTKPPEKVVVFGDQRTPFGDDLTGDLGLPMDKDEQKRIEEKLNLARKEAIVTLTGIGHPLIADISKADTFAAQSARQDKLLRDVALVFHMTNNEINLSGGEFTSGKECYSEDTQTLTQSGWKYFTEIKDDEKIACYNPSTDSIEYNVPKRKCVYYHNGKMIHFKNKDIDILVTDNHKMYIPISQYNRKDWIKVQAKDVFENKKENWFKAFSGYENSNKIEKIKVGNHESKKTVQPCEFDGNDFLEFLGYWISEGCIYKTKPSNSGNVYKRIEITQSNISDKKQTLKTMKSCLDKMGLKYSVSEKKEKKHEHMIIYHNGLYDFLEQNIGKYQIDRKIPFKYRNIEKKQLKILFNALMAGDGFWDKGENATAGNYVSISETLTDNVADIAIKLGYYVYQYKKAQEPYNMLFKTGFSIRNKGIRIKKEQAKIVDYKGYVHCFETETGLYFTKRNGKITIQGNTSETQQEIEEGKGTRPIIRKIEALLNRDILPYRFGTNWVFAFTKSPTDDEQIRRDSLKKQSGTYSVNEIREDRGDDPYPEDNYDRPEKQEAGAPGASENSPMYIQENR